jgi:hypothetical protein
MGLNGDLKRCPECSNSLKADEDVFCSQCGRLLHSYEIYYRYKENSEMLFKCDKFFENKCLDENCAGRNISKCDKTKFLELSLDDPIRQSDIRDNFGIIIKNKGDTPIRVVIEDNNHNNFLALSAVKGYFKERNEIKIDYASSHELFFETDKSFENSINYKFEIFDADHEYIRYCIKLKIIRPPEIKISEIKFAEREINILGSDVMSFKISNTGDLKCDINLNEMFFIDSVNGRKYSFTDLFKVDDEKNVFSIERKNHIFIDFRIHQEKILKKDFFNWEGADKPGRTGLHFWKIGFETNEFEFECFDIQIGFCFPPRLCFKPSVFTSEETVVTEIITEKITYIISNDGYAGDLIVKDLCFNCHDIDISDGFEILEAIDHEYYLNSYLKLDKIQQKTFQPLFYKMIVMAAQLDDKQLSPTEEDTIKNITLKFSISKDVESSVLDEIFQNAQTHESYLSPEEMNEYTEIFKLSFNKAKKLRKVCDEFYAKFNDNKDLIFLLFIKCYEVFKADGFNNIERSMLKKIKKALCINIFEEMLDVGLTTFPEGKTCRNNRVIISPSKMNFNSSDCLRYEISLNVRLKEWPLNKDYEINSIIGIFSNDGNLDESTMKWKYFDVKLKIKKAPVYNGVVAIDFGTTNSCVAWVDKEQPEIFKFDENEILKSVVFFENEKIYHIGLDAYKNYKLHPTLGVRSIKTFLGKEQQFELVDTVNKRSFKKTADEIIRIFMNEIIKRMQEKIKMKIKRLILTIPIDFISNQQKTMKNILKNYDIKWLPEPIAYVYSFIKCDDKDRRQEIEKQLESSKKVYILNIDFGGGTIDLALVKLQIDPSGSYIIPSVVAYDGRENIGGDLIDKKIRSLIFNKLEYEMPGLKVNNELVNSPLNKLNTFDDESRQKIIYVLRRVLDLAERIKLFFSGDEFASDGIDDNLKFANKKNEKIRVPVGDIEFKFGSSERLSELSITRSEYISIIDEVINKTCVLVDNIIDIGKHIEGNDMKLWKIVLSGQTFKSSDIKDNISKKLSKHFENTESPIQFDEVSCKTGIARGALEYALDDNVNYKVNIKKLKYSYGYKKKSGLKSVFKAFALRNEDTSKDYSFDYNLPPSAYEDDSVAYVSIYINKGRDEDKRIEDKNETNENNGIYNLGSIELKKDVDFIDNFITKTEISQSIKIIARFDPDSEIIYFYAVDKSGQRSRSLSFNFEYTADKKIGDVY